MTKRVYPVTLSEAVDEVLDALEAYRNMGQVEYPAYSQLFDMLTNLKPDEEDNGDC